MITEKRAYIFAWSVVAALTAAGLLVLLQAPGIQPVIRIHADGSLLRSGNPLALFHLPAVMAVVILLMKAKLRFAPPQRAAAHRQWQAKFLVGLGLVVTAVYGYTLALALGWSLPFGREAGIRGGFVVLGLFTAFFANSQPKLPWLNSRFSLLPRLSDADGARLMRLTALLGVLYGLGFALCGALLPMRLMVPVTLTMAVAGLALALLRAFWLRRHASP